MKIRYELRVGTLNNFVICTDCRINICIKLKVSKVYLLQEFEEYGIDLADFR